MITISFFHGIFSREKTQMRSATKKMSSMNKLRIQYGSGILLQKNTGILVVRWNVQSQFWKGMRSDYSPEFQLHAARHKEENNKKIRK